MPPKTPAKLRHSASFKLRLPPGLLDELMRLAEERGQAAAEIVRGLVRKEVRGGR